MRILYLDIDTLRPDHLGCYGYSRNTSPNIDEIAAQGVRFNNYHTSDAPCLPSRTALMTGQFGIHSGVVGHGATAADVRIQGADRGFRSRLGAEALPMIFRRAGLQTASISPFAERHSAWQFYAGFTEMHNTGKGGGESAEEITPVVLAWLDRHGKEDNWFLHVNYWDPHGPYRAPPEFGEPFEYDPLPEWLSDEVLARHWKHPGPHGAQDVAMYSNATNPKYPRHPGEVPDRAALRKMIDGYDCGIRWADANAGMIFDKLREQGVLDDVAIIISSDHGENQGELAIYGEHATADNITTRIPMIVRWPGARAGHIDDGLHYNLDLAPTLAELFDQESMPSWDGRSYAASLREGADTGRDYLVLSQCCHVCQRSVRFDNYLYMRTYHDGFHLFPREMLFDLEADPHEQRDLAETQPELCHRAAWLLSQWHDEMMLNTNYVEDPLWTVMHEGGPLHARGRLKKFCERLEATGRAYAIPELKRRHPREFQ